MLFNFVLYLAILTFFYPSVTDESFVHETRVWRIYKILILVSMLSSYTSFKKYEIDSRREIDNRTRKNPPPTILYAMIKIVILIWYYLSKIYGFSLSFIKYKVIERGQNQLNYDAIAAFLRIMWDLRKMYFFFLLNVFCILSSSSLNIFMYILKRFYHRVHTPFFMSIYLIMIKTYRLLHPCPWSIVDSCFIGNHTTSLNLYRACKI